MKFKQSLISLILAASILFVSACGQNPRENNNMEGSAAVTDGNTTGDGEQTPTATGRFQVNEWFYPTVSSGTGYLLRT